MIKICVGGSKGKMGGRILELAKEDAAFEVVGGFDLGDDAGALLNTSDCLIEFTAAHATLEHLKLCVDAKKAIVIGTTGLSDDERSVIAEASRHIPVVYSPNMSIGVNCLFKIVKDAASILGPSYQVEIVEAHHAEKKDAPSGTAKELSRIIKEVRGDIKIPVESVREGEIVGEHTITFDSDVDTLEITHSAKTRDIFVKGALAAAKFIVGKEPRLYTMQDVLGI